ncbi:hypothetical protein CDL15_Pgr028575 [Punica granatum]|uniref:SKP1-like protein n=1 Tax=Punica granatum TaxID=22663 RepID=A0A218VXB3_PUNGR|nr:hypothetical protein CDL15_Pgr028575 [Punica granatum]
MSPSPDMVTLKTSDDEIFEVEVSIAMEWKVVKHMIEDDCVNNVIPLKNVSSKVLRRVIEYCQKHVESGAAATSSNPITNPLLGSQAVANMIKGRSVEDIRRIFNIKNDFSPDEETEVKRQNQWAFEEADNCLP